MQLSSFFIIYINGLRQKRNPPFSPLSIFYKPSKVAVCKSKSLNSSSDSEVTVCRDHHLLICFPSDDLMGTSVFAVTSQTVLNGLMHVWT